jgi:hypothetical protein
MPEEDKNAKMEMPDIIIERTEFERVYLTQFYSACSRIYVAAHTGFFVVLFAFLAYLYFLLNFQISEDFNSILTKIGLLFISFVLAGLCGYFFMRHKTYSQFLLRFEKKVKIKETGESLRQYYFKDLYPKSSHEAMAQQFSSEQGRETSGYTKVDYAAIIIIALTLIISLVIIALK